MLGRKNFGWRQKWKRWADAWNQMERDSDKRNLQAELDIVKGQIINANMSLHRHLSALVNCWSIQMTFTRLAWGGFFCIRMGDYLMTYAPFPGKPWGSVDLARRCHHGHSIVVYFLCTVSDVPFTQSDHGSPNRMDRWWYSAYFAGAFSYATYVWRHHWYDVWQTFSDCIGWTDCPTLVAIALWLAWKKWINLGFVLFRCILALSNGAGIPFESAGRYLCLASQ